MNHATTTRDGYTVPLIGIPPDAALETCDLCGELLPFREITFTGKQFLCGECL